MTRMQVSGVYSSAKSAYPQVVLKEVAGSTFLPIAIGRFEAAAISAVRSGEQPVRPISYDLGMAMLEAVDARIERVQITELREGIYYAEVHLRASSGEVFVIDSRPSDAIALALRADAPILAAREVLEEAGYVRPEDSSLDGDMAVEAGAWDAERVGHSQEAQQRSQGRPAAEVERRPSVTVPAPEKVVEVDAVAALREQLERAVTLEKYELAARLRDELRRLEGGQKAR